MQSRDASRSGGRTAASSWFHTLVVIGASLSACGKAESGQMGGATSSGGAANGGRASGGAAANTGGSSTGGIPGLPSPSDCASDAQFSCSDYAALTGCHCLVDAPTSPASCMNPFAFRCTQLAGPSNASPRFVACECADVYDLPTDCNAASQFFCQESGAGFVNCACDLSLPAPLECTPSEYSSCQSYDPMFGCHCECCRIK